MSLRSLLGVQLHNRYKLLERVGSGGFSSVYLARDEQNGQIVAVKILHEHLAQDPSLVRKFHEELAKAARLQHPNVVSYLDQGDEQGMHFLVMEFLQGQTLAQVLKSRGRLPVEQILSILTQVAQALQAAEGQGIVHRDLKPENLMILPNGQVKVMDFGIAKDLWGFTHSSVLSFTPRYASPEQISGQGNIDIRSDLYALGVILYEMLTGVCPFPQETPVALYQQKIREAFPPLRSLRPDLPAWIEPIIWRLLSPSPEQRQRNPAELIQEIRQQRANAIPSKPTSRLDYLPRAVVHKPSTPKWLPWAIGGCALILLVVTILMVLPKPNAVVGVLPSPSSSSIAPQSPVPSPNFSSSAPSANPTPVPVRVVLRIESVPEGAAVTLNGNQTGQTTPFEIVAEPGEHTVRLQLDGYKDWEDRVKVADQPIVVPVQLEKAAIAKADIILGLVGPLTGDAATFGKSTLEGAQLAIDERNAKGGIGGSRIILKYADDKGDPTEGAAAITRLINLERIIGMIGTVQSKVSLAIAPICQAKNIPMISPTSTNAAVTLVGDFIFRSCFIDPFQGTVGAKFAWDNLKVTKAACIFDVGNDYTKGLSMMFRDGFIKLGGTIVGFEAHPTGATDFNAQLTKILAASPELIYISDFYFDVGLICKQARAFGYKGYFLGGDGWDSPELVTIGGDAVEGGFFINHFSKDDPRPEVQVFVNSYNSKFGAAPDALATLAYDATNIMLDAIEIAGSLNGASVRDAMASSSFGGVSGSIRFDANRNPIKSGVVIEIKNGQQQFYQTVFP